MKTGLFLIGLYLGGLSLIACTSPSKQSTNDQAAKHSTADTAGVTQRTYPTPAGIVRIEYQSAGVISVSRVAGSDTLRVPLQGDFQSDGVIGCDSCLLVKQPGTYQQTGGYAVNDSLFLLTIAGTDWRALLYGINLKTGAVMQTQGGLPNDHLETYLDAFVYDVPSQQLITSNSLAAQEETTRPPLTLNRYVVKDNVFVWKGQITRPAPANLRTDAAAMQRLLKSLPPTP